MDIVAYSQLHMDRQHQVLRELQDAVRNTSEFARAQAADQLIRLPTGELGVDTHTLAKIAGHSSILITQRYVHPGKAVIGQAFEKLSARKVTTISLQSENRQIKRVARRASK